MTPVQLFTVSGEKVTDIDVPPLVAPPEVIRWGVRTFVLKAGRYVECLAYDVP